MDQKKMMEYLEKAPKELTEVSNFVSVGMKAPQKISMALGASQNLGKDASNLTGGRHALVVSDDILLQLGMVDMIVGFLTKEGFTVETFSEVEPEPHLETAEALYHLAREKEISVVVGLGGGSVMDIAKLAAQALGNKIEPEEFVNRKTEPNKKALPLILLPTTAGTGSEASMIFVISYGDEKRFFITPNVLPDIAIIDPLLTVSMPPKITANTGMDVLTHAIEAHMHLKSSPLCETIALGAIEMVMKYLRRAVSDGEDLEARYHMAISAAMGMMAINMSGGLWAHSISYVIPLVKNLPHGLGCSLALPFLMDYNLPAIPEKLARIAEAMGESNRQDDPADAAKKAVKAVAKLIKDIDLPFTLREAEIEESVLEEMSAKMVELYPRPGNPRPMSKAEAAQFWKNMYQGVLEQV